MGVCLQLRWLPLKNLTLPPTQNHPPFTPWS